MRRLFSLLPLLLPLPNLVQAADPVCTLENRVCAENNNSGKCIRYENTFTCVTVNPAGSRCTVDAHPTLRDYFPKMSEEPEFLTLSLYREFGNVG